LQRYEKRRHGGGGKNGAIPIFFAMFFYERVLREIPNNYSYKKEYLDKNASQVEILFLGSSHIFFGINPKYMTRKTFSGAHNSQLLTFDLAIL